MVGTISRRIFVEAAASLAGMPRSALSAPSAVPILLEDSRIYVATRIGGGGPYDFILDTGASPTLIDTAVADDLKLRKFNPGTTSGAGAGSSTQSQTDPVELVIGDARLRVEAPKVSPLAQLLGPTSSRAPQEILGSQFFKEHVVAIDFQRRRLQLYPPEHWQYRGPGETFPLDFVGDTPLTQAVLTTPGGRAVSAHVLLDLGAKSTLLLPEPFIEAQSLRKEFPLARVAPLGAGWGATLDTPLQGPPALA